MNSRIYIQVAANTVALIALWGAAELGAVVLGLSREWIIWIFGAIVIASIFLLRANPSSNVAQWLTLAGVGCVVTVISFALDCAVGKILHPDREIIEAGVRTIGFLFTVIALCLSLCAVALAIREWVIRLQSKGSA